MKKNISGSKERYIEFARINDPVMVGKKIVLSQQMKKIQKQQLKKVKLIRQFHSFITHINVKVREKYNLELRGSTLGQVLKESKMAQK